MQYHVTLVVETEEGDPQKWDWLDLIGDTVLSVNSAPIAEGMHSLAAPEMHKALVEIGAFSDSEDQMDEIISFRWLAVDLARAALAKARGEEVL